MQQAAVQSLTQRVLRAFTQMKTFASMLDPDEVDPQLRNNPELSKLLIEFEEAWMAGTEHLLDPYNREDLIQFSEMIQ